jgi:RHS repeat-associated protein
MGVTSTPAATGETTWGPWLASGDWLEREILASGEVSLPAGNRVNDADSMHARFYNPQLGRFLSVDPAGFSMMPDAPQSWNRYTYVLNNPMILTDPTGLAAECTVVKKTEGSDESSPAASCNENITVSAKKTGAIPGGAAPFPGRTSWGATTLFGASLQLDYGGMGRATSDFFLAPPPPQQLCIGGSCNEIETQMGMMPLSPGGVSSSSSLAGQTVRAVRGRAVRKAFLRDLATDPKTAAWMKPWLARGKVPPGYNVDHIVPLSVGGADAASNMRLVLRADHIRHHRFYHPWR